jgi:GH15 family glucan-1,4-alpha-glucosidase
MHASRLTQPRLQVLYSLDGSQHTRERGLELSGYRGSRPVRIGNGARAQVQLDIYGAMLEAIWIYARSVGRLDGDTGKEVARIADYVEKHWRDKDNGIWEVRDERAHYIQSKGLCWVALDRACALGEKGLIPNRNKRWRAAADELKEWVDEHGWDDELQSYVRAPDLREVDASLLTLAVLGYQSERLEATIAAVERDLREGPYVYRYRGDDGLEGEEGAFLTCSFWLVDAYARTGRLDDANALMDELVGLANDVGLYSEEIDPRTGEFLGNFPQGLTHLALINAAVTIADVETEGRERAA